MKKTGKSLSSAAVFCYCLPDSAFLRNFREEFPLTTLPLPEIQAVI